jgi:alpha-D-xyloside xylohydrolase
MRAAAERGLPPMRPLFVDFPGDPAAWRAEDQFLFGPDLLVAPVLAPGATEREVYLPAGRDWTEAATGARHAGGRTVAVPLTLDRIPVFVAEGAEVLDVLR